MDISSAKDWQDAVSVVWSAPQVVVPLLVLFAGGGYWLGRNNGSAGKEALREKNDATQERVKLANEKEAYINQKYMEATKQIQTLNAQIVARADISVIEDTTTTVARTIQLLATANGELRTILSGPPPRPPYHYMTQGVTDPILPPRDDKSSTIKRST